MPHLRPSVHLVAGTRPEAVKLAPVAHALCQAGRMRPLLVDSGQHDTMVPEALADLGMGVDLRLELDRRTGTQPELLARLSEALEAHYTADPPAAVVVQGDTTTAFAAALVAFYHRIPVVHLEAGLRSGSLDAPFPEEANRQLVGRIARLHLAPTERSARNLHDEGVDPDTVLVIGNTVVDAVVQVADRRPPHRDRRLETIEAEALAGHRRLVLVTAHRRESWGEPLDRVLATVSELAEAYPDLSVVVPAHPNPDVRAQVDAALGHQPRVLVTDPLPYGSLCRLLAVSTLALSDSGGIQEEAPSFGVPVLVLRDVTERTEGVDAGCSLLVGTDPGRILPAARRLLDDETARTAMTAAGNPYGDGRAGERTEQAVAHLLGLCDEPPSALRRIGTPAERPSACA